MNNKSYSGIKIYYQLKNKDESHEWYNFKFNFFSKFFFIIFYEIDKLKWCFFDAISFPPFDEWTILDKNGNYKNEIRKNFANSIEQFSVDSLNNISFTKKDCNFFSNYAKFIKDDSTELYGFNNDIEINKKNFTELFNLNTLINNDDLKGINSNILQPKIIFRNYDGRYWAIYVEYYYNFLIQEIINNLKVENRFKIKQI